MKKISDVDFLVNISSASKVVPNGRQKHFSKKPPKAKTVSR